jgi:transcriptional regulator with XRE-family HTH domain
MSEGTVRPDGLKIRAARKAKGWTQEQLADKAGYALSVIQKVETGKYFGVPCLEACAKALGEAYEALSLPEEQHTSRTPVQPLDLATSRVSLWVLVVGEDGDAKLLCQELRRMPVVKAVYADDHEHYAWGTIRDKEVNTIFIDPLVIGLDNAERFIFGVRYEFPEIVFVLYADQEAINANPDLYYSGPRQRFRHYYSLDKKTIGTDSEALTKVLRQCEAWVRALPLDPSDAPSLLPVGHEGSDGSLCGDLAVENCAIRQINNSFARLAALKLWDSSSKVLESVVDDLQTLHWLCRRMDCPNSLNKIRYITEKLCCELCKGRGVSWGAAEPTLERMIGPLVVRTIIPKNVALHVRTIQNNSSPGSHYQESPLSDSHVSIALAALGEFLTWYQSSAEPGAGATRKL